MSEAQQKKIDKLEADKRTYVFDLNQYQNAFTAQISKLTQRVIGLEANVKQLHDLSGL